MTREKLKNFGILNAGVLIMTAGVYFFKFPNHFTMGGVSGLALVIGQLSGGMFSPGLVVNVLNIALMLIGFLVLGRGFGVTSAYASLMFSVEIAVFELLFPMSRPFTDEPLLELIFAVMLPAFGSAIVFNIGASTGGTDIVAMILKKYSSMNIGRALLVSDLLIVFASCFVFDIKSVLFSVLGLAAKALVVDSVIENINLCKYFTIITKHPEEIGDYITHNLHRSATRMQGYGAFTQEGKAVYLCVVTRQQAVPLRDFIRQVDPKAFVLITNTSEIIGKGFRGTI